MRYAVLLTLLAVGCLQAPAVAPVIPKKVKPVEPLQTVRAVEVSMDANVVANLHQYLGDHNTYTIKESQVITQNGMTVSIPAGANLSYVLTETGGMFTFNNPKPQLTVKEWGISFHPMLDQVVLTSPNKGTAVLNDLGQTIRRNFVLDWERPSVESPILGSPVPLFEIPAITPSKPSEGVKTPFSTSSEKPEVWAFGDFRENGSCPPCSRASKELAEYEKSNELPFRLVKNPLGVIKPANAPTPVFLWPKRSDLKPKGSTTTDWKLEGWHGVDYLIKEFNRTRSIGTVTTRTRCTIGIGFWRPYVETDRGYTSVGHLTRTHHVDYEELKPYLRDQNALNRIHGWCHLREMNF